MNSRANCPQKSMRQRVISKQETEKLFRRLLKGGLLQRMPKSMKDSEIFLALAASVFDPQLTYSEAEVNEHLSGWLSEFASPVGVDHVTVRRYLCDFYFLLRDASGSVYTANQTVINSVIEPAARSVQPHLILGEMHQERVLRKQFSSL